MMSSSNPIFIDVNPRYGDSDDEGGNEHTRGGERHRHDRHLKHQNSAASSRSGKSGRSGRSGKGRRRPQQPQKPVPPQLPIELQFIGDDEEDDLPLPDLTTPVVASPARMPLVPPKNFQLPLSSPSSGSQTLSSTDPFTSPNGAGSVYSFQSHTGDSLEKRTYDGQLSTHTRKSLRPTCLDNCSVSKKVVAIVAAVVVLLAGAGVGLFFVLGPNEVAFNNQNKCHWGGISFTNEKGDEVAPSMGYHSCIDIVAFMDKSFPVAIEKVTAAINLPGAAAGAVAAAPPTTKSCPTYKFTWIRDQAIAFELLLRLYQDQDTPDEDKDQYEDLLKQYAAFTHQVYFVNRDTESTLGDAHYNLDGSYYGSQWCNPQNDGPARRSVVLSDFAKALRQRKPGADTEEYIAKNIFDSEGLIPTDRNPVLRDFNYLMTNWDEPSACDPWEEVRGRHFYDKVLLRRAFLHASELVRESDRPVFASLANETGNGIERHWVESEHMYLSEESNALAREDDVQTILASIHSKSHVDGFVAPSNTRSLSNFIFTIKSFHSYYAINRPGWKGQLDIAPAIGRYTGDKYAGEGSYQDESCITPQEVCPTEEGKPCVGQPWFLTTLSMAEFLYIAVAEFVQQKSITVDAHNYEFFEYVGGIPPLNFPVNGTETYVYDANAVEYHQALTAMIQLGDGFVKRAKFHMGKDYRMDEQFNGDTGGMQSAGDLTWAYGSLSTAILARRQLDPETLIPSFDNGLDTGSVRVHFIAKSVPIDTKEMVVVWETDYTASKGCVRATALTKRTDSFGVASEWSAFVQVPRNSVMKLRPGRGSCKPDSTNQEGIEFASESVAFVSKSANLVAPIYHNWCGTEAVDGECYPEVEPINDYVVTFIVRGAPQASSIGIIGDVDEIGNWDTCKAVTGEILNGVWEIKVKLPIRRKLKYKAIRVNSGNTATGCDPTYEGGLDREITTKGPQLVKEEIVIDWQP